MKKYTALVRFKVEIEASDLDRAIYIANQALPTHFGFMGGNNEAGRYLRSIAPVIFEQEDLFGGKK